MPYNISSEDRAVRIIQAAVREANQKIADYVRDRLASGKKIDASWLQSINAELARISDLYSSQAVNNSRGEFIAEAKAGAYNALDGVDGGMQTLDEGMINMALVNTKIHVKDITDSSVKVVSEIITNAIVSGKSNTEIAKAIQERVVVEQGAITNARAEMIARSEMASIYRQAQLDIGQKLGYEYYEYIGPDDDRTEEICQDALNIITTLEEWEKVDPLIRLYGLHYGCRHELYPVTLVNPKSYPVSIGGITITAYK